MIGAPDVLMTELGLAIAFPRSGLHQGLARRIVRSKSRAQAHIRSKVRVDGLPTEPAGHLYCAFHFRGHFGIPRALSKQIRFSMLVDSANSAHIEAFRDDLLGRGWGNVPALIDANAITAAYRMFRILQSGGNIFLYADGNDGAGAAYANGAPATLFDLPVTFRARFLDVARLAGTPVMAIVPQGSRLRFRVQRLGRNRSGDGPKTGDDSPGLARLLTVLEGHVLDSPDRWDEWHQLPYWIDYDAIKRGESSQRKPIGLELNLRGQRLLFDRRTGAVAHWRNGGWATIV